ncbi:hypothetical protein [Aeromonas caviae]|uniref:hypothetical protein n=1 Tax=Aeromonas caviae TaxID=648 RepID=UPI001372778D|nr:hypothetical protein [Aeromonas caviae]NAZ61081.1 hypothetical protein [Aeromonas caviae]GKR03485.1 hypothetical protein KAM462_32050 [Aeromonas caviae]GKR11718.1 hypothetical protein KAM465_32950 [Aeromonas caviae]GKR15999.1 hypothetical protein KAM466_33170 [Aeromonas caviae]GKR20523.1 hypothetical protein KAM467_35670 [Aeromonas caviae]
MYTYDISFPEHAEKLVHPDHLLTTHCPVHIGELVILGVDILPHLSASRHRRGIPITG